MEAAMPSTMFRFAGLMLVLAILFCASPVMAADGVTPPPGTKIRLTYPCRLLNPSRTGSCREIGNVARWTPDSLTVAWSESTATFSRVNLSGLEVSDGRRSYRGLGAGVGFLLGAGATHLILNSGGSTSPCDQSANQDAMSSSECLGLTALGGAAGAGLGFVVGGLFHSDRWKTVSLRD
jgi:hypothetical protein